MTQEQILLTTGGTIVVAIITALSTWAAKRSSSTSEAQHILNEAFEKFVAATNKRINDLEEALEEKDRQVGYLEVVIGDLRRHISALESVLNHHNIPVPPLVSSITDFVNLTQRKRR